MHRADKLFMAGDGEAVGHAGDIVGDAALAGDFTLPALPAAWKTGRIVEIILRQAGDHALRLLADRRQRCAVVKAFIKEGLELALFDGEPTREADQRRTEAADVVDGLDP